MMKNFAKLKPSVVFVTDDIQTTYANMKSKGVEFEGELTEMQWELLPHLRMRMVIRFF